MFKLLVVEDDRELNRSVCAFLNQSGYEASGCLCAGDAYDAMYGSTFGQISQTGKPCPFSGKGGQPGGRAGVYPLSANRHALPIWQQ